MPQDDLVRELQARLVVLDRERAQIVDLIGLYSHDGIERLLGLDRKPVQQPPARRGPGRRPMAERNNSKPTPLEAVRTYLAERGVATRKEISAVVREKSNTSSTNVENLVSGVLGNKKNFISYGKAIYTLVDAPEHIQQEARRIVEQTPKEGPVYD